MAQKVQVQLIDDLDGTSTAEETVTFGLDGVEYEIDLSGKNASNLRDSLDAFVDAARRTGGRVKRGSSRPTTRTSSATGNTGNSREQNQAIREWARKNGHPLSERGRIPGSIVAEFEAAQAKGKK